MTKQKRTRLRAQLLSWFKSHGRHDLPWKKPDATGYHTVVSEIMLQQTQVSTVLKKFSVFMEAFPSWEKLAQAQEGEVFKAWEGLGYYRRARFLHRLAQTVVEKHQGLVPLSRTDRLALPGVGFSTASALGAFVYGVKEPIWDGNVDRVYRRLLGGTFDADKKGKALDAWRWETASALMPSGPDEIKAWTQAIMDLGATVCTPKQPKCSICPWLKSCAYANTSMSSPSSLIKSSTPPSSTPKPSKQQLKKKWSVLLRGNQVALVAPSEQGLWTGLWQFPDLADEGEVLAQGIHELTHRQVHWVVQQMSSSDDVSNNHWVWKDLQELEQLPFPRPLRKWLDGGGWAWLCKQV